MDRSFKTILTFFVLLGCLLVPSGARAASSETRDWQAAEKQFSLAASPALWKDVQSRFAIFLKKYPNSDYFSDAVLYEARAMSEQGRSDSALALLAANSERAGRSADAFAYWTARFHQKSGNLKAAADNYARLIRDYPDSPFRPESILKQAELFAALRDWPAVIHDLQDANGAFQQYAAKNPKEELVLSGRLLLAQAQLEQRDFSGAASTLALIDTRNARPDLQPNFEWDRQALLVRLQLGQGQMNAALQSVTNLITVAAANDTLLSRSLQLQAQIYEAMEKWPDAVKIYEANLKSDNPKARNESLLKIVELDLRQNQLPQASQAIADYLAKYPADRGADLQMLLAGELLLKQYYSGNDPGATNALTNTLSIAEYDFLRVATNISASPAVAGKAQLNLGWCSLAEGKVAESQSAFRKAVEVLPFSADRAVAQFKLADLAFQAGDLPTAITGYSSIISHYDTVPEVKNELFENALYQIVRAALLQTNLPLATDAMQKILAWFPQGVLGDRSLLLIGQSESPVKARQLLEPFARQNSASPLLPEVELAIARTYEREGDWSTALHHYDQWLTRYTNSSAIPRAEFSRAWADYRAGHETNAYLLFTNFVARFTTNALAPKVQYWVGDYFWNLEEFQKAELNYEEVFNKWPDSMESFAAQMMAGNAAIARESPQQAQGYYTNLMNNPKCPPALWARAAFAFGDSTLMLPAAVNSNRFDQAITIFKSLATDPHYTNTLIAAQAWGRLGDCYYMMASNTDPAQLETAAGYFKQAMNASGADATLRSTAQYRLGESYEAIARLLPPAADGKPVFKLALDHFYDVFSGASLPPNEKPDRFWARKAALESAKLAEETGEWRQAIRWYEEIGKLSPVSQPLLDKKIAKARENLAATRN